MEKFSPEAYVQRRKKMRMWGWIGVVFALFDLLDSKIPFPIPLVGSLAVYVSVGILIPAAIVTWLSYRHPDTRVIAQLAERTNGYITATFLVRFLDVKTETAEEIILELFKKGYLEIFNRVQNETPIAQWICLFVGIARQAASQEVETAARDENLDLGEHTQNNPEMDVSEINDMLLRGTMNLSRSGQPTNS